MSAPDKVRVIGLLGGMSWPSTITYYREINNAVQTRLGGSHSARMLIWSDDYYHVEQMQISGRWKEAGDWLAESASRLEAGGADILGIACNTMHVVADAVRKCTGLPLVDMIEVAAAACGKRACPTAVLGTRFTLQMGRYSDELLRQGVYPILPSSADMAELDRVIYEELCVGRISDAARRTILDMITRIAAGGAGQILLACTELNLLVDGQVIAGVPIVDAARMHIEALVASSLGAQDVDDAREVDPRSDESGRFEELPKLG